MEFLKKILDPKFGRLLKLVAVLTTATSIFITSSKILIDEFRDIDNRLRTVELQNKEILLLKEQIQKIGDIEIEFNELSEQVKENFRNIIELRRNKYEK